MVKTLGLLFGLCGLSGCALIDAAKGGATCDLAVDLGNPDLTRTIDTCRTPAPPGETCGFPNPGTKLQFEVDHQDHYAICATGFPADAVLSLSGDCGGSNPFETCRPGPCVDRDLDPGTYVLLVHGDGCTTDLQVTVTGSSQCTASPEVCVFCQQEAGGCFGDLAQCQAHFGCLQNGGVMPCGKEFGDLTQCLEHNAGQCFPTAATQPCLTEANALLSCKGDQGLSGTCGICPDSCPPG